MEIRHGFSIAADIQIVSRIALPIELAVLTIGLSVGNAIVAKKSEVEAAVGGDRDALERLLRQSCVELRYRLDARIPTDLNSVLSADEVLQEAMVDVFRSIEQFDPRQSVPFEGWLQAIADNRMLDAIRHHRRLKRGGKFQQKENSGDAFRSSIQAFVATISDRGRTPSQFVVRDEAIDAMRVAIAKLPDEQRTAITLHCLMHRSMDETSELMNRSTGSVRGLIHRGKQSLRNSMEDSGKWLSRKG